MHLNISGWELQNLICVKVKCACPEPLESVIYIFKYIYKHIETQFISIYIYPKFYSWSFIKPTVFIKEQKCDRFKFPGTPLLLGFLICFVLLFLYSLYSLSEKKKLQTVILFCVCSPADNVCFLTLRWYCSKCQER